MFLVARDYRWRGGNSLPSPGVCLPSSDSLMGNQWRNMMTLAGVLLIISRVYVLGIISLSLSFFFSLSGPYNRLWFCVLSAASLRLVTICMSLADCTVPFLAALSATQDPASWLQEY